MNILSISKFRREKANCIGDDLLITNIIEDVEQFKFPCRIDAITFLVCFNGNIDCRINLKDYNINRNEIIVNFPENIIQIQNATDFDGFALLISSAYLEKLHINIKTKIDSYMSLKVQPSINISPEDILCLKHYYYLINQNIKSKCTELDNVITGIVSSFVFKLISIINECQHKEKFTSPDKPNIQKYFEDFMSLLFTYHSQERSIMFYANKMNLTSNYLSCIIKQYSGKPAPYWVAQYVILEAEVLLKISGMNVQQVAYKLTFPSQSMFGKSFKRQTGITAKAHISWR